MEVKRILSGNSFVDAHTGKVEQFGASVEEFEKDDQKG